MSDIDWDSEEEQSVMDAFVDGVFDGNESVMQSAGAVLIEKNWGRLVLDGMLVREDDLPEGFGDEPYDEPGVELLEGRVSVERFEALSGDASPTAEELATWRGLFGENLFTGDHDYDVYQTWGINKVVHTDGREAYAAALGGGYSFTGSWDKFVAGALSIDEALTALRLHGFTDIEDFRARWNRES